MGFCAVNIAFGAADVNLCALGSCALIAFCPAWSLCVETSTPPLLDALDHLCYLVDGGAEVEREFFAATTPEQLVALAVNCGILIDADDFRALLTSGSTQFWEVSGDASCNPIAHLQQVFSV
jgi:hypothetical protein